ncbi:MAG: hypothetical protein AAGA76_05125 [Pseudomonadota bacterium]
MAKMFWEHFIIVFLPSLMGYLLVFRFDKYLAPEWLSTEYPYGYLPHAFVIHGLLSTLVAHSILSIYPERPELFSREGMNYSDLLTNILISSGVFGFLSCLIAILCTSRYWEVRFHKEQEQKKPSNFGRQGAAKRSKQDNWWRFWS